MKIVLVTGASRSGKTTLVSALRKFPGAVTGNVEKYKRLWVNDKPITFFNDAEPNVIFPGFGISPTKPVRRFGFGQITTNTVIAKTFLQGIISKKECSKDSIIVIDYTRIIFDDNSFEGHEKIMFVNLKPLSWYREYGHRPCDDTDESIVEYQEMWLQRYRKYKDNCTYYEEWDPHTTSEDRLKQLIRLVYPSYDLLK